MTRDRIPIRKPFKLGEFFLRWEWILVVLIIGAIILNGSLSPYFLNVDNLFDMTFNFMEKGLMALPMTFVIITAGIDLSVASNLAMTSNIMGQLFVLGVPIWIAVAVALLVGSLAGFFNAMLITRVNLPPLAATLGTYVLYRGIAWVLTQDGAVTGFPPQFTVLGQGDIPGTPIPIPLVIFIVFAIPFGLLLHRTTFGRYTFAIGNSVEACRYSGVPIKRVLVVIYTMSGFMAALAGVLMSARFGSVRADIALGAELDVITAVVLGGVDIFGGSGTMPGVVLALFLLGIVRYGMNLVNIPPQIQIIVTGLLLIVAIILPSLMRSLTTRQVVVAGQPRKRRSPVPWIVGAAVVVLVILGLIFLLPGMGGGEPGDGGGTGSAVAAATATPVVIPPTHTPPAAPPTPTPKPTNTPQPTPTSTPTSLPGEEQGTGEPVDTPTPTSTPDPRPETEMAEVAGGPFTMGADDQDPKESPAHEFELPTFYIDRFEVTNNDFARFVADTGYETEAEQTGAKKTWQSFYDPSTETHPVVKVSFRDAQAFCEWMGKRLPTEAEWEKAARGTDSRNFPWGGVWDTSRANVRMSGLRSTVAVGSFSTGASPYGVEDMSGNVMEWTDSPFLAYPDSSYVDPQYSEEARVLRGGGWFDDDLMVRTSSRNAAMPGTANDDLGFRCVADSQ